MAEQKKGGASPYATGGGGVTLERAYGATLLAAVLVGDPVPGLGDDMHPVRVEMQAGLLRDLAVVATGDTSRRRSFRAVWPSVMDAVLDAVAAGRDLREEEYGGARALAGIVPRPIPTGQEADVEGVVRSAATGWPTVAELAERVERWLPLAAGTADGVDALVGFLETAPLGEQIGRLSWVTQLVSADLGEVAGRSYFLPGWLEQLRASGQLDATTLREYQRMVDGLAAAGDSRALRLQVALEQ
jgi:hypothetical protein